MVGAAASWSASSPHTSWISPIQRAPWARQHARGGKRRRFGLSKRGNAYLRRPGARALVKVSHGHSGRLWSWLDGLRARRPLHVVLAALAHKLTWIVWALLSRREVDRVVG